jgi:PAS domain S-box-containing protein
MTSNNNSSQHNILSKLFKRSPVLFIGLSFALIIMMMITMIVLSIGQLSAMRSELENIITYHNSKIEQVQTLRYVMRERMLAMHQLVIEDDPFKRDELMMGFDINANRFIEAIRELQKLAKTADEHKMVDELRDLGSSGNVVQKSVIELLDRNKSASAKKALVEKGMPAQLLVLNQAEKALAYYKRVAREVETETRAAQRKTIFMMIALGGLASAASFLTALTVIKRTKADREDLSIAAIAFETQEGIMITNSKQIILRVNQAFTKITGYTANEAIGQTLDMLKSDHQNETLYLKLWDNVNRAGAWQGEIRNRYKNGAVCPNWLTITVVKKEDGTIANYVVMITDISERKKIEARLIEAKEEAELANKAKTQFISSMSHELRTPLNAILGFGQLLELEGDTLGQEQQESVNNILTAGQQLLGLINGILDLSRIDMGKMDISLQPLCIAEIVSGCMDQVAVAMGNKRNITFENSLTDTKLQVMGDDLRLRQVLINLLSNAVKYNNDNGKVSVSSVIENNGWLRIEVRDTGPGVAKEKHSLLFTPFERLDQKHGTISGVGIGLYISKQLVEAMQGTVGVDSEPGKGSAFWFELPLAEEVRKLSTIPEKTRQPILQGASGFSVLLIEDNLMNVELIKKAMKSRPAIEFLVAGTAEEGMTIAEEVCPSLILMDINLPGIDGITATTLLKKIDATRNIPVVALSANAMRDEIDRALASGCQAYLTKPVKLQELYEVIDKICVAT